MEIYLHTIALEPERWTPKRVSLDLPGVLDAIALAGFHRLEIFEPHATSFGAQSLRDTIQHAGLSSAVLSSYLQPSPHEMSEETFEIEARKVTENATMLGCSMIRAFPGKAAEGQSNRKAMPGIARRIARFAEMANPIQIVIETHDHMLGDDWDLMPELVQEIGQPNVALLFQPTVFTTGEAIKQAEIQHKYVRHVHLQNRDSSNGFASIQDGVVDWTRILPLLDKAESASIEFVRSGMRPANEFNLRETLAEAASAAEWVRSISANWENRCGRGFVD